MMAGDSFGWGDVTLREFAALDIIRDPNALARLNRFYDNLHADPANVFRGDRPNRLTPDAEKWLADMHERYTPTTSARDAATMARELLDGLGILTVMNATRAPEERDH